MTNQIKATRIELNRAEGPTAECGKVSLDTMPWTLSDAVINKWAISAPKAGNGYDKVDFVVYYEDGETYSGRFDMQAEDAIKSGMIANHMRSFVEFSTGEHRPAHLTPEQYKTYIHNCVPNTQEYKDFLVNYALG